MSSAAGNLAPQFVSQNELSDSQKRREKEIREAYARYVLGRLMRRIGEEPPPAPVDETYDPRPLYEVRRIRTYASAFRRRKRYRTKSWRKCSSCATSSEASTRASRSSSLIFTGPVRNAKKRSGTRRPRSSSVSGGAYMWLTLSATETKGTAAAAPVADKIIPTIPKRTDAPAKRKRGKDNALGIVRKTTVPPGDRPLAKKDVTGAQAREATVTPKASDTTKASDAPNVSGTSRESGAASTSM